MSNCTGHRLARRAYLALAAALAIGTLAAAPARASELIVNGGFDNGLSSWNPYNFETEASHLWVVNGGYAGIGQSTGYDAENHGFHWLQQSMNVPLDVVGGALSFDYYAVSAGPVLDALHDPVGVVAYLYSDNAGYILPLLLYNGDQGPSSFAHASFDLSAFLQASAGGSVSFTFEVRDDVSASDPSLYLTYAVGLDNVSLQADTGQAAVPEPVTFFALLPGAAIVALRRRRMAAQA